MTSISDSITLYYAMHFDQQIDYGSSVLIQVLHESWKEHDLYEQTEHICEQKHMNT